MKPIIPLLPNTVIRHKTSGLEFAIKEIREFNSGRVGYECVPLKPELFPFPRGNWFHNEVERDFEVVKN